MTIPARIVDLLSSNEDNEYHTEAILNVFRESDDVILGSADVEAAVGMTTKTATSRLKTLAEEDRVVGKKIGQSWAWTLHPDERRKPVPTQYDRLVHGLDWIDARARLLLLAGMFWMVVSLSSVYWAVTRTVVFERPSVISPQFVFEVGWLFTAASGLLVIGVVVASTLLWMIEWLAVRRMPAAPSSDSSEEPPAQGESRGQVTLRMIFGGFILLVLAKPLALAAIEIYQGLAASPAFSSFGAALFALGVVAVIIAAIFDGGR